MVGRAPLIADFFLLDSSRESVDSRKEGIASVSRFDRHRQK